MVAKTDIVCNKEKIKKKIKKRKKSSNKK